MIRKLAAHNKFGNDIKNIPLFSDLSDDELHIINQRIIKKKFTKDQIVLFEEDTAKFMYLIYDGKVRVVKQSKEGREQIITMHNKGEFFGEMSLLDGKTAPATVIAHDAAVIGLLSKNDFVKYILCHERVREKIIDLLCGHLRDSWAIIKILSFDNAEKRIIAVLERLQELYGVADDRGVIINIKLTHQQIANYASAARETTTRILKLFEKNELLRMLDGKKIQLTNKFYDRDNGVG
ncbi:MAG: Crp/Fnr family transcriptional regulator [Desulfuromonadales bacterium]